jgi:hypothetical protein
MALAPRELDRTAVIAAARLGADPSTKSTTIDECAASAPSMVSVSVTAAVLARDHFGDASGPSAASIEDHIRQVLQEGEPAPAFRGLQQFIGLNLKLGYFGLTGDSNAMLPIRIMFEKDAVSLCGAVDVWLQLFHLALLNGRDVYWAAP